MSTDIKPGQVWAWQDTYDARGPHGSTFEIVEASPDAPDVTYQYRDAAGFDPEQMRAAPAEAIRANANLVRCVCRAGTEDTCNQHSATPAPLDPSKVKAGDTVTVTGTTTSGATYEVTGVTWEPSHSPGSLWVGPVSLDALPLTLTDHRPAPEPEPEWKPGTVGTAEVVREGANGGPRVFRKTRGMIVHRPAPIDDDMFVTTEGEMWAVEGLYCKDFVPDEPRPLPTLEQVEVAVYRAGHSRLDEFDTTSWKGLAAAVHHHLAEVVEADASLAHMRGESR